MGALILENFHLLDSMYEGLIVVSSEDSSLKFASQPATNLFSENAGNAGSLGEAVTGDSGSIKDGEITTEFLIEAIFVPTEISLTKLAMQTANESLLRTKKDAKPISLKEIIQTQLKENNES